ncbi:MAG: hypothetical protein IPN29_15385 [Saprospiraceae bacterium]|nr:hypothetical protein [Saprospiraceae bacterium]
MTGFRKYVMVCLMFAGASIFSSLSAQYVGREQAIERLTQATTSVMTSISNLPNTTVEYRYGRLQISTYKALYGELVNSNASVANAVTTVFAQLDKRTDSNGEKVAAMTAYNKKYPETDTFDIFHTLKKHINDLLKG